jgi:hypothetical protein
MENSMYVLIFTEQNFIYILYNKTEQDLYNMSLSQVGGGDTLKLDTIHNDYRFYYNIYSLTNDKDLESYSLKKAEISLNRLVILYKHRSTKKALLNIYDVKLDQTVHQLRLTQL